VKKYPESLCYFWGFQKSVLSKQSPNVRKFARSGHPDSVGAFLVVSLVIGEKKTFFFSLSLLIDLLDSTGAALLVKPKKLFSL
jgi:hypothetical protein